MNKLLTAVCAACVCLVVFGFSGCAIRAEAQSATREKETANQPEGTTMKISVQANGKTTTFELNDSNAAKDLYAQLPLTIAVENYSTNEKIFYPPKKLDILNTPLVSAKEGTLAYYAPWGDVIMFYGNFPSGGRIYGLGHAIQGAGHIREMSGALNITKAE